MPSWLMKIGDDEYVIWSTVVDAVVEGLGTRDEALEREIARACANDPDTTPEMALEIGKDRLRFTDQHLCSCRARIGEQFVKRNGRLLPVGGGRLAYEFASYDEVRAWMADSMVMNGPPDDFTTEILPAEVAAAVDRTERDA